MLVMNLNNGCTKDTFKEVSLAISKKQLKENLRKKGCDYYHTIRMKLNKLDSMSVFQNCDTIFLLETYEYETGVFYGKIWGGEAVMEYSYKNEEFTFGDIDIFTAFTCELIKKWDINTIKKEERENSTMTSPLFINVTRVIIEKDNIKVDCIGFNEFFLLERDR